LLTAISATPLSSRPARAQASAISFRTRARLSAIDTLKAYRRPGTSIKKFMWTILLLTGSNIFMTFAWYGHLKYRHAALWKVILISWSIAFFEYCLQVPANRIGAERFSPDQLKVIQEIITLMVFGVFSVYYFGDRLHWNHAVAFCCLVGGAFFMFHKF
jgi:uncharacterized protein